LTPLTADIAGNVWKPKSGQAAPTRAQLLPGSYTLQVYATDAAGNFGDHVITVTRSAFDTTVPDVTITTPLPDQVFSASAELPQFVGTAGDAQTGISDVRIYLYRLSGTTLLCWDGFKWGTPSVPLAAEWLQEGSNANSGTWKAPPVSITDPPQPVTHGLPKGANLPNGDYQVQVYASNNEVPATPTSPPPTRGVSVNFKVNFHQVYTWTGATLRDTSATNDSSDWKTAANWSPNGVPGPQDVVIIGSVPASINDVIVSTGTTSAPVARSVYALDMRSCTLSGFGLSLLGTDRASSWTGGTIAGSSVVVPAGVTLNLAGGANKSLDGGTLSNSGVVVLRDAGKLSGSSGAVFTNQQVGRFEVQRNGACFGYGNTGAGLTFVNNGLFTRTAFDANGATNVDAAGAPALNQFVNNATGVIWPQSGTVSFNVQGAGFTFNGGKVVGNGVVRFEDGNINLAGSRSLVLDTITSGAVTSGPGTVHMAGGRIMGNSAATSVLGLAGPGLFQWTGGEILSSTVNIPAAFRVQITDLPNAPRAKSLSSSIFNNSGNVTWDSPIAAAYAPGTLSGGGGAVFNNLVGGLFDVKRDGSVFGYTNTGVGLTFNNQAGATFLKSGGTGTATVNIAAMNAFNNMPAIQTRPNGAITAQAGTLKFLCANAGLNLNSGNLSGLFQVSGTPFIVNNTVTLNGTLDLLEPTPGTTRLTGISTFTGAGTFNWNGGALNEVAANHLTIGSSVRLNIKGSGEKLLTAGKLTLNGPTFWTDSGNILSGASAVVTNNGIFTVNNDRQLGYSNTGQAATFVNNGSFVKAPLTASPTATTPGVGTTSSSWTFSNKGTVNIKSGILALTGDGSGNGIYGAGTYSTGTPQTARIDFLDGNHAFTEGVRFTDAGLHRFAGAGATFTGNINNTGNIEFASGRIAGTATLTGGGTNKWTGGTIAGNLTVPATETVQIMGTASKTLDAGILNNSGKIIYRDSGQLIAGAGATINNKSGATFEIKRDGDLFGFTNTGVELAFNNSGLVTRTMEGGGTSIVDNLHQFVNNGTGVIWPQNGVLSFNVGTNGLVLNDGNKIVGDGAVKVAGGILKLNGITGLTTTTASGGGLTGPGTLEFAGGSLTGATNAALNRTGLFKWSGGSVNGALSIDAATRLSILGATTKTLDGSTINNAGVATWAGTVAGGAGATINNTGTLSVANNSRINFTNTGVQLLLKNQGTLNLGAPGLFGTSGKFQQTATGRLNLKLGGLAAGTQHDQLQIGEDAALAGILDVQLVNGFVPAVGNAFTVIKNTAGPVSGIFTGLAQGGVTTIGGQTFLVNYNGGDGNDVVLTNVPHISINDPAAIAEGNSGNTNLVFTVTLSKASTQTITVAYAAANGTALQPSDYLATSGSLAFAPGQLSKTVTVPIVGDYIPEAVETLFVNLSLPTNAVITDAQGKGTINNDDTDTVLPTLSFTTATTTPVGTTPVNGGTVYNSMPAITGVAADAGSGVAKVELKLYRATATAGVFEYWNGAAWGSAVVYLPTVLNPAAGGATVSWTRNAGLPGGANLPDGTYYLAANATDRAGKVAGVTMSFKAMADTTVPSASFTTATTTPGGTTPVPGGTVFTSMPAITGVAADAGSGIAKVELKMYRATATAGVFEYWNGTAWSTTVAPLPATLSPAAGGANVTWSRGSSWPSGAALPIGTYYLAVAAFDKAGRTGGATTSFKVATAPAG